MVCFPLLLFVDMFETGFGDAFNMAVSERIIHFLSVFAEADEIGFAQNSQLVRDRRFAHAEDVGNITDAEFTLVKRPKNFHARDISEDFEKVCEAFKFFSFEHLSVDFGHDVAVDNVTVADKFVF